MIRARELLVYDVRELERGIEEKRLGMSINQG